MIGNDFKIKIESYFRQQYQMMRSLEQSKKLSKEIS